MFLSVGPSRACGSACGSLRVVAREQPGQLLLSRAAKSQSLRRLPQGQSPQPQKTRWSFIQIHSSRAFSSTSDRKSRKPRISYRVAASSSGKSRPFLSTKDAQNFNPDTQDAIGVAVDVQDPAAKRKRRPDSGEDAFFVSTIGRSGASTDNSVAFAVADGVGGWAESRVDPADFSHAFCDYMAQTALAWDQPAERLRAKALLQAGYDRVVADKFIRAGGSTASVGVGLEDGRIELANLGDSGSVLFRQAAVHHYSIPQTHGFNTPYQLSIIPPRIRRQASIFGGAFLEDSPRDAIATNLLMQHGDVLMLATDGVFDNLNNQDILKLVTSRMLQTGAWVASTSPPAEIVPSDHQTLTRLTGPEGVSPLLYPATRPPKRFATPLNPHNIAFTLQSVLAASITEEAKLASMDFRRDGPFAKKAQRYYPGDYFRGGKVDDIAVLIIVAVEE